MGGPGESSEKTSSVAIGAWRPAPHIRCLPNHSEPAIELDPQRAEELLQAPSSRPRGEDRARTGHGRQNAERVAQYGTGLGGSQRTEKPRAPRSTDVNLGDLLRN